MERGKGWKYRLIMGASRMIGALPEWFLYGCLGRFVTFVLYRLLHYRVKVVRRNLSRAFPKRALMSYARSNENSMIIWVRS